MREPTRSLRLALSFVPVTLALAGCGAASAEPAYIGKTYSGRVMAEIYDSDLPITKRSWGSATAQFRRTTAGKARLTVTGDIRGESAGFTIEGRYDDSGFRDSDPTTELTIDPTGRIVGRGVDQGSEYRFSGTVSAKDMALTVVWRPAAGAPDSTLQRIEFTYTVGVEEAVNGKRDGDAPLGKGGKPCRKTRVEQRAFPSFDGGPMTMGMVIVCDD
jgi:hypothetical protein